MVRIFLTQLDIKLLLSFLFHLTFVYAPPGKNTTSKILFFYPTRYDSLITRSLKTYIVHIFDILADISFSCPFFHLPVVKLLEALAHYANTNKQTLSTFIDSSIDNFLAPDQSRLYQSLFDFTNISKFYSVDTLLRDSQIL